ncbi:MAG: phage protein GemA/Gp16 family protein [Candidatus Omnitrophota bacterium]
MLDQKKLALIHIIKKELKLNDREYRDILTQAAGVRSAKDLTPGTFRKLMRFFVRSKYYRESSYAITLKQKMYIDFLAKQLGWSQEHLDNFIHKYYHKLHRDYLNKKEAAKVIESLKNVRSHQYKNRS